MSAAESFVIVGAGLAGAKGAEALREQGFAGAITLIGDEAQRPYERPSLSKDYLTGKAERDAAFVHDQAWYDDQRIALELGVAAVALDPATHSIRLSDERIIHYDKLLLATGASPRLLSVPGSDAGGVYYLRRIEDSERLQGVLASAAKLVVIGAGWIGLEVAAAARQAGLAVTVVEIASLPLLGVLGADVARVFEGLHTEHGVVFRFDAQVTEITVVNGRATGVRLADGSHVVADAVLVAIGATPNVSLAEAGGLAVDNGIVADAALRTSDPDIVAAGDVVNALHPFYGRPIRVEHWANALNQPATAAPAMLGQDASYDELPYFYTDQYDLGMEYVGYVEPDGYDEVVFRGDVAAREFIAFWLKDGRVLAGMNVNVWDVVDPIKALIRSRATVDVTRLADPDVPLDQLV